MLKNVDNPHTMEVNGYQSCLITNIFWVQQKKEMNTGLEQHDDTI